MFQVKETELKLLLSALPGLLDKLEVDEQKDLEEKIRSLQEHWVKTKSQLENRVDLGKSYVEFHTMAEELSREYDLIEEDLRRKEFVPDDAAAELEMQERCRSAQELYVRLSRSGENFIEDSKKVGSTFMNTAMHCN